MSDDNTILIFFLVLTAQYANRKVYYGMVRDDVRELANDNDVVWSISKGMTCH